MFSLDLIFCLC